MFTTNELRELGDQLGIARDKLDSILESINIQGHIIKKGGNKYQLTAAL